MLVENGVMAATSLPKPIFTPVKLGVKRVICSSCRSFSVPKHSIMRRPITRFYQALMVDMWCWTYRL